MNPDGNPDSHRNGNPTRHGNRNGDRPPHPGGPTPRPAPAANPSHAGPPPWLWLLFALYLVRAPALARWWTDRAADLLGHGAYPSRLATSGGFLTLVALSAVQLMPVVHVLAGVLGALLPGVRRRSVERRYGLLPPAAPVLAEGREVLDEIARFLADHAPRTELQVNPVRRDQIARVYPGGPRSTRIAAFEPLLVLWRRDRGAAGAVLLHELGHRRAGEQHLAGIGSPFPALVRRWPYVFALCALLPVVTLFLTAGPAAGLMPAQLLVVVLAVPHALLVPVCALWTAELAADRHAATVGGPENLRRALEHIAATAPRGTARLHHPPLRLRQWFAARTGRPTADLLLLAALPAALLADLALALVGAVPAYHLLGATWSDAWWTALVLARRQLAAGLPWGPVLAVLLLWPLLTTASRLRRRPVHPGTPTGTRIARPVWTAAALLPAAALLLGHLPTTDHEARAGTQPPWPASPPTTTSSAAPTPCPTPSPPSPPQRPRGLPSLTLPTANGPAGPQPDRTARSFRTARVTAAVPLIGGPARTRTEADRLARVTWTLHPDGTLTASEGGGVAPLRLRPTAARGTARLLTGSHSTSTAVSVTTTWADARLVLSPGRPPELTLLRATTAIAHAVVNCRAFDATTTVAARYTLTLTPP
ncbi:hypothetical protein [Streptomyces sp. NPDC093225]|uniref:hypothetical protein n=1 Tax=Streptomyces sp. NPDC093225 TaxID=3366034 RepID=UPI0037F969B7